MLLSFRVANHRSLRDEQELLLVPQYGDAVPAVPVAAIFGANAAGKSNVLDAIEFLRLAVRDSYQRWSPTARIPRKAFHLDPLKRDEPSWYAIEVLLDGVRWSYGFELDDDKVIEEWLYTYPQQRRRVLFERRGRSVKFGSTVNHRRESKRALEELTRDNALFLSLAAQTGLEDVLPMYTWLDTGLCRVSAGEISEVSEFLMSRNDLRDDLLELLKAADLGISGLQLRTEVAEGGQAAHDRLVAAQDALSGSGNGRARPELARELDRAMQAWVNLGGPASRLRLVHGGVPFELADESAGTLSWLGLLPAVLTALTTGQTLVIDELDTSLHPRLVARVIELFRSTESNSGGGQLVFTTHDATLLTTSLGVETLRRDEIWFVEKGEDGASSLFPLSDFKPRKEENTMRRYLGGSYGAVPAVFSDSLVAGLIGAREHDDAAS